MKAFITGGSGFIGRSLIRQLVSAGYDVNALVRTDAGAAKVTAAGANPVFGDITHKESLRPGMEGSDVVFHAAGWNEIGSRDWMRAETTNVDGTRNVLTLAVTLGVPKIIYTSSVAVFGDTHGQTVDENYFTDGPFELAYERTKWLAHYKVAVPLIRQGAPIIIVMPSMVYGPGDPGFLTSLMRLFLRGMPALPGPDTTFCYAHVDDVARGHILAAKRGKPGESYILAGAPVPLDEMVDFWSNLSGKHAPRTSLATTTAQSFLPLFSLVGMVVPVSPIYSAEMLRAMGQTQIASSAKAERDLGWQTRPLQSGMLETLRWATETQPPPSNTPKVLGAVTMGGVLLLIATWLMRRSRQQDNP